MLPNFLIIGAPRSGTTWMEKNLRQHPDVFLPKTKELHFFDQNYNLGIAHYESYFQGAESKTAVGEATPDYLHGAYSTNDIPRLIHRHLPDVKLIVSLRNPIQRAYSRYWNSKALYAHNRRLTFEEKLQDRPEFVAEGMYWDHLNRYLAVFPRDQILILFFDDLVSDPRGFLQRVYTFLNVDPKVQTGWESVRVNQATGRGNLARSRFFVFNLARVLTRMRMHGLAQRFRDWNSLDQPAMAVDTWRSLRKIYFEQNRKLEEFTGRDLSHWDRYESLL